MRTNIVLDEKLTSEAFSLTGLKTKRELVHYALQELVFAKKQLEKQSLCEAFETLHHFKLDTDPFPEVERQDRDNPFANQL